MNNLKPCDNNIDQDKPLLRCITCGWGDKFFSSLLGQFIDENKEALTGNSAPMTEHDIMPNVLHRTFSTEKRRFIVSNVSVDEQQTGQMIAAGLVSDLCVLMIDARCEMISNTRRILYVMNLLNIQQLVLVINKMDLVDYSQESFEEIVKTHKILAKELGIDEARLMTIPMSLDKGDNVAKKSHMMDWYHGPSLMEHLEAVSFDDVASAKSFRMSVETVERSDRDFCSLSGHMLAGCVEPGDEVRALPSSEISRVESIVLVDDVGEGVGPTRAQKLAQITLSNQIDISPGSILCHKGNACEVSDQFRATLVWLSEDEMLPGRAYLFETCASTVQANVASPRYVLDVTNQEKLVANTLVKNAIGSCNLSLDQKIAFDPYNANRSTGTFNLIDQRTNQIVAVGFIEFALRRAANIHWQALDVDEAARAEQKNQLPAVLWFTGLSGSGKSTIANALEKKLFAMGRHTMLLDGDNVRHGLNRDLGFTEADRVENVRRVSEVSQLMLQAGLITLVSFISPFRSERNMARERIGDGQFIEIFVDTPLSIAEERDVKGLYKKARAGEIKNFTGIDSPYEAPENPEITINTVSQSADEAADIIIGQLQEKGFMN
ncbi:MAG: adenylyl-sulfate kinase [Hyphomicrobiales bacterium]